MRCTFSSIQRIERSLCSQLVSECVSEDSLEFLYVSGLGYFFPGYRRSVSQVVVAVGPISGERTTRGNRQYFPTCACVVTFFPNELSSAHSGSNAITR